MTPLKKVLREVSRMKKHEIKSLKNKQGFRANGSILPLALRPGLHNNLIAFYLLSSIVIITEINLINSVNTFATSTKLTISDNISLNVNPNNNVGFAVSDDGLISIDTDNPIGYTLSIKAKDSTNNNNLVNIDNHDAKLTSITETLTPEQYEFGYSDKDFINTWGFKPSNINNDSNRNYIPGPDSTGIVLAKTTSSNYEAQNYTLTLAAKVDSTLPSGTYKNTFILTSVANEARYTIEFDTNGGSGGPSSPQTGLISSSPTVTINSPAPNAPSGKDFLGWCTENPGTSDTCSGALIQPGGKYPLCNCDLDITLYAMYGTKPLDPGADGADCNIASYKGKVYGGYCWMWQDLPNSYTYYQINSACPENTHLPSRLEFETLISHVGYADQLYKAGWYGGFYWTSTDQCGSGACIMVVKSTQANVQSFDTYTFGSYDRATGAIRCVTAL